MLRLLRSCLMIGRSWAGNLPAKQRLVENETTRLKSAIADTHPQLSQCPPMNQTRTGTGSNPGVLLSSSTQQGRDSNHKTQEMTGGCSHLRLVKGSKGSTRTLSRDWTRWRYSSGSWRRCCHEGERTSLRPRER